MQALNLIPHKLDCLIFHENQADSRLVAIKVASNHLTHKQPCLLNGADVISGDTKQVAIWKHPTLHVADLGSGFPTAE